ncbi:MAG TPA: type II secretion system protein [Noviherbaspirillum sp.]|nr:type II secretion system protein [Noviherbaspirillum sp.]
MMINLTDTQRGFTLVESIMVIVITGIIAAVVAVFIRTPVQAYFDGAARAELADVADTALRRMARDLRLALPNSVRVDGTGSYIELLLTRDGGRYLAEEDNPTGANPQVLDFNDITRMTFEVVGPMPVPAITQGDYIVVYNLGPSQAPADAYDCSGQCNRAQVASAPVGNSVTLTANPFAAQTSAMRSPSRRFQVVTTPVTYGCAGGKLTRYWNYTISPAQPTPPSGSSLQTAVLANNVSCAFAYNNQANTRAGLIALALTITGSGEAGTVRLFQQVHVDNTP